MNTNILKKIDIEIFKENHRTGKSLRSICKRRNAPYSGTQARLYKAGYILKSNRVIYNHQFFENIDTPEKAYILGFIEADGCVHVKNKSSVCRITQTIADKYILEAIRDIIAPTGKVVKFVHSKGMKGSKPGAYLNLYSKQIPQDLIQLGCTPRKSATLRLPTEKQVPLSLMGHFLRGYFDGDGCISYGWYEGKHCLPKGMVSISTSKAFCEDLRIWVKNHLNLGSGIYPGKGGKDVEAGYTFKICGNKQVVTFMNYIYQGDISLHLKRKREKYLGFLSSYQPK